MKLREYQVDLVNKTRDLMRQGTRSILICSEVGSGKTLLAAHMLKAAASKGMSSFFICHRVELVRQSLRAFYGEGIACGVVASGFLQEPKHLVQICSIQTLVHRWHKLRKPTLLVWDESHHMGAASWSKLYAQYPQAFHILLTATPRRLDQKGLGAYAKVMLRGPSMRWLIDNKFLSDYKIFVPSQINVEGVHKRMGDYVSSELAERVDKPTITGNAVAEYKKRAFGKRAIARGVSIQHSKHIAEQFNAAGIPARHVDGDTPAYEREAAMKSFTSGETLVLTNVDLFSEGVSVDSVECLLDLRPTQSLTLWLQFCGRALRTAPGKTHAIILDMAGNCLRLGLPDDERDWDLSDGGKAKKSDGEGSVSVKVCPKCFAAQFIGKPACSYCGHIFELKPRKVDHVEGELVEADVNAIRMQRKKEQGQAKTREDLHDLAVKRGYKNPWGWVHMIMQARQRKKLGVAR